MLIVDKDELILKHIDTVIICLNETTKYLFIILSQYSASQNLWVNICFKSIIALEAMATLSQSYTVHIFSLGFSTTNVFKYLNIKQSNFTIKHNDRSWII